MGLNVNTLRRFIVPPKIEPKNDEEPNGGGIDKKPPVNPSVDDEKLDSLINTHTYFSVYEGITNCLGDFYTETLAKMTGADVLNKRIFNQIYNGTMNSVVKNALERAKSGEILNFKLLAQNVKEQITAELEACNYDPVKYQQNQIDDAIQVSHDLFNK